MTTRLVAGGSSVQTPLVLAALPPEPDQRQMTRLQAVRLTRRRAHPEESV